MTASTSPLCGERALGLAGAPLQRRQDRRGDRVRRARQRARQHALKAGDAHDLLDEIGLALDVGAPGRHLDRERVGVASGAREREAERLEIARDLFRRQLEPGEPLHLALGERDPRVGLGHHAGERELRGRAAAELEDELRRQVETGHAEGRIDAALEAIACI